MSDFASDEERAYHDAHLKREIMKQLCKRALDREDALRVASGFFTEAAMPLLTQHKAYENLPPKFENGVP